MRLINRTTRHQSLTEAGQTFYRHCVALIEEAQAARDAVERPDVRIALDATNRRVMLSTKVSISPFE